MNRATGRREGGLIGLTSNQTAYVYGKRDETGVLVQRGAVQQLQDLDPAYFNRKRRDARFDRTVSKAIREGKRLSQADVDRITGAYKDRLLGYRGEVIARTETLAALQAGKMEAARQLVDSGKVLPSQVKKVWRATGDSRTRDTHLALNLSLIHISEPTRRTERSRMPSSA